MMVCLATRQAKAARGALPVKTDRNAARARAQIVRTGWFRPVPVKSAPGRSWRALLTARRRVLNKLRDLETGVRARRREAGLKLGTPSRQQVAARVRELTAGEAVLSAVAEPLLAITKTLRRALARRTKQGLAIVRGDPVCRRWRTVPGVGPLTALAFRATVD